MPSFGSILLPQGRGPHHVRFLFCAWLGWKGRGPHHVRLLFCARWGGKRPYSWPHAQKIRCGQIGGCSHRIIKLICNNQTTTRICPNHLTCRTICVPLSSFTF